MTALSLTACVLLSALWARSYRHVDNLSLLIWRARVLQFSSGIGQFSVELRPAGVGTWPHARKWHFISQPAAPIRAQLEKIGAVRPTFRFMWHPQGSILFMRFWIPVFTTGFLAALVTIRWSKRFSLRTLLIATTLVAVVLGIAAATK